MAQINLYDIVWDMTVGAGEDDEFTPQHLSRISERLGRELTPAEVKEVRAHWSTCLMEMAHP